jgi:uncharacterized membrane protein
MTAFTIIMLVAVLILCWVLKTLWGSKLFWIAALALTVILFPLTAGLSPLALFALIVLRLVMLGKAFNPGNHRA